MKHRRPINYSVRKTESRLFPIRAKRPENKAGFLYTCAGKEEVVL